MACGSYPQGLGGGAAALLALVYSNYPLTTPGKPRAATVCPETHNLITALGAQFRVVSGLIGGPGIALCLIRASQNVSVHCGDGERYHVQDFLKAWSDQRSLLVPVGLGWVGT